jgi:hypothetical protein
MYEECLMDWVETRKHGCRLQVYEQHGLRHVTLENRALRVTVVPDKGADIIEFRLKSLDLDVLWTSPIGMRDPRHMHPSSDGSGPMMDFYEGGWQEIVPSGGPPSTHMGAIWGQHGESTTLPWDMRVAVDEPDHVAIELRVRLLRYPLTLHKTLHLRDDTAILEIDETLTNEAYEPIEVMWGHHPTVGAPFLSPACRFYLPGGAIHSPAQPAFERQQAATGAVGRWPTIERAAGGVIDLSRMPAPEERTAEMLNVTDLLEGWYAIANDEIGAGFGLCWDVAVFPHLWYWQVARGSYGYPWYGRTYSMALEPWTSPPGRGLATAVEHGTALRLEAGQSRAATMYAMVWEGRGPIARVTPRGVSFG